MSRQARVLVADDHAWMREEIRDAVDRDARFTVCAEASSAPAAVELAVAHHPDICLLDIGMPGDGIAAAQEIARRLPETRIIMLTVSDAEEDVFKALRAGASGYLLKNTPRDRLVELLAAVAAGDAVLAPELVGSVIGAFRDPSAKRRRILVRDPAVGDLTSREWEVLELLRQGLSTREIAGRFVVSEVTVRTHVASVLRKLKVSDRSSLYRLFANDN